jgi:hypothetical protein
MPSPSKLLDENGDWIAGSQPYPGMSSEEGAAWRRYQKGQNSVNPIIDKLRSGGFGQLPTLGEFQSLQTAGSSIQRGVQKSVGQTVVKWIDCTPYNTDGTIKTLVPVSVDWKRGCRQYLYLTENRNIYLQNPLDQTCCLLVWQRKASAPFATITFMDSFTNALYPKIYWMGGVKPTMTATLDVFDMLSFTYIADLALYTGMYTQNLKVRIA